MRDDVTDYTPGDAPVPVGTVVSYEGGHYFVDEHVDPTKHPHPPTSPPAPTLEEAYPDGVAYHLWMANKRRSLDNGHFSKLFVRRTSFRVIYRQNLTGSAKT